MAKLFEDDELFFASLGWEREWQKTIPKLSEKELVKKFEPTKEILAECLIVQERRYNEEKEEVKKLLRQVPEKDREIYEGLIVKFACKRLKEVERHIYRLKRLLSIVNPPSSTTHRRWIRIDELIEKARLYPIEQLARDKLELSSSGDKFVGLCPFHEERTGSCYFYPESNTFYCFGCQAKGDVITFYMRFNDVDFKDAVQALSQ